MKKVFSKDVVLMNLALDNYESYDLTEEDFEFFQEKAYYWMKELGLIGWELAFTFAALPGRESELGSVCYLLADRSAIINLLPRWTGRKPTSESIEKVAFHEVNELRYAFVREYMTNKTIILTENQQDEIIHNLIRTQENIVLSREEAVKELTTEVKRLTRQVIFLQLQAKRYNLKNKKG